MTDTTTIEIKKTTHAKLVSIGGMGESFDAVVNRLIPDHGSIYSQCDDAFVKDRLMHHHHLTTEQVNTVPVSELRDELMHRDGEYIEKLWSDIRQRSDMVLELIRERDEERS